MHNSLSFVIRNQKSEIIGGDGDGRTAISARLAAPPEAQSM